MKVPMIPAAAWNALVADLRTCYALEGQNCKLRRVNGGRERMVTAVPSYSWRHPFQLLPRWDPGSQQWMCGVEPGFVNGTDCVIQTLRAPAAGGKPVLTWVPLTDPVRPEFALAWRSLIQGGLTTDDAGDLINTPGEGYPSYFASLGVVPPDPGTGAKLTLPDPTRTRQLWAGDVILSTPVISSSTSPTVEPDGTITFDTTFENAYFANNPQNQILPETKYVPNPPPDPSDILSGAYVQPNSDDILIGTVYALSPPNANEDDPPDATFQIYPKHNLFWNVAHQVSNGGSYTPPSNLSLVTGLAGGVADGLIASLLDPINDDYNQLLAYLNAATTTGIYWTV
jgi:hypothetical protein